MESKNENENQNTNARLDFIKQKCEEECKLIQKKNNFILALLNEIGSYLDKDFIIINEFDLDANYNDFKELFDFFTTLCIKKPEKILALQLISCIILETNQLTENYMKLIEEIKKIVLIDNCLKKLDDRIKLMNKLMDDVKLCLNREQNVLMMNYSKLFEMNIILLIEISIYLFSDNINSLLNSIIRELKNAYPYLIVSDTYLSNIENIDINCINQLLTLKFTPNDQKMLFFEDSKFLLKNISNEELNKYINEDFEVKKSKKSKKKKKENVNESQQNIQKENLSKTQVDFSPENLDYNKLTQTEKLLLDAIKKNSDKLNKNTDELNKTKEQLNKNTEKLNMTIEELNKNKDELNKNKDELNKMKQNNMNLIFRIGILESELNQIKIRSLYKGIIDGFSFLYNINLNDNYYSKLKSLLSSLEKYDNNKIVNEFKDFLYDVYSYLERGNYLAHNVTDNKAAPLELVFSTIEKAQKKDYSIVKKILSKLSFDEYLKNKLKKSSKSYDNFV